MLLQHGWLANDGGIAPRLDLQEKAVNVKVCNAYWALL